MFYDKEYVKSFQKDWPLEKLKSMTLYQYSNSQTKNRDNFLYWVVFKKWRIDKDNMKETFGIYKHIRRYDDSYYDWDRSIYNTEEEAFEKNKNEIIKVAQYSQKGQLDEIYHLKLLHFQLKWRIAFLYQNLDDTKMFDIFSEISQRIINGEEPEKELLNLNLQKITKGENMKTIPPLNQILYGPPGTGKTYNTINKALEILGEKVEGKDRAELKAKFDEYRQNGQIEFVTFHQSFSYEEFVEGIKPKLIDSSEGAESSEMSYTIKSGIFKEICKSALSNLQNSQKDEATLSAENQVANLFEAFIEHIQNKQDNDIEYILNDEKNWFVSILNWGNYKVIKIFSDSGYLKKYPVFLSDNKIKRYYKDFKLNHNFKIRSKENRTGYIDTHRFYTAFFKKMREFETTWVKQDNQTEINIDNTLNPYILIIDEINRGNISKILGELITLIEPSKRIGASDEEKARGIGNESLEVTLPYSNETFGVPSNLYIIGTMNTADRSIALLDTALRRRFEFVEMMPDSSQLKPCGDIDLAQLLDKMNERIEFLLDREHTIGHSFFIGVDSLDRLREVFKLKIIPLLQEYFYDDYAKIDAVLNGNGMVESKSMSDLGVRLSEDFVDSEKRVYRITESRAWNVTTFAKIYE